MRARLRRQPLLRTPSRRRQEQDPDLVPAPEAESEEDEPEALLDLTWRQRIERFVRGIPAWIQDQVTTFVRTHPYAAGLAVWGFIRSLGVTVQSGEQGLMYSFGRATRVLEPGLHLKLPFVQRVRIVPSRSRTLDIERQQVATLDGLVYAVDANLVWRIVDVRSALVEVDDLVEGMRNALATSVWSVLKDRRRESVRGSVELDEELAVRMQARLDPWGVRVERAGFQSIAPTGATLELLQLRGWVAERERLARAMTAGADDGARRALAAGASLGLVGTPRFPARRQQRATRRASDSRRRRLTRKQAFLLARLKRLSV